MAGFVSPILSAASSIFGGLFGSGAASKAAGQQENGILQGIGAIQGGQQNATNALNQYGNAAQSALNPYATAGAGALSQLTAGLQPGGNLNANQFTPQQILSQNPGYNFQLQQGDQAIQRQASANGTGISGGELKDISTYNQQLASTAYQQAFENFNTTQSLNFSRLASLAGSGQQAATGQAGILQGIGGGIAGIDTGGASQLAGLSTSYGATQAGGTLGSANAITGALSGVANAGGQFGSLLGGLGKGSSNSDQLAVLLGGL